MIKLTMPGDVRAYVLEYQGKKKSSTGNGHYSQQHAIWGIIREHKELVEENLKLRLILDQKNEGG